MTQTAVIAGVGPGLGASLAHRFAGEGLDIGLLSRTEEFLETLRDSNESRATATTHPEQSAP
jgi:short-subunit dehydrogenase